jgi:hypothetical protein
LRVAAYGLNYLGNCGRFFGQLPCWIDAATCERAEAKLARLATQFRPDQLVKLADKLADCLNPTDSSVMRTAPAAAE